MPDEHPEEITADSIDRITKARLPLSIPWHPNKYIRLGTLYHSSRPNDPWSETSPFNTKSLSSTPMIARRDYGSQSTFKSHSTSRTTQRSDHLEIGFGVGVGLPFLASVTVQGSHCKEVQENSDQNKTSVNFSTRMGSISFEKQPCLTHEAIITVKYDGGLAAFESCYGDYYLAAYVLGGDTGILVSGSGTSKRELEKFGITVTVEVLFVEVGTTHTKDFVAAEAKSEVKFIGYDTLGHSTFNSAAGGRGLDSVAVKRQVQVYCESAKCLDVRVADKLDELDIQDGEQIDETVCRRLIESGLVVELLLLPVSSLREVRHWMVEDDVI